MGFYMLCEKCLEFVDPNFLHKIVLGERDELHFIECPNCQHVWIQHDKWEEDE